MKKPTFDCQRRAPAVRMLPVLPVLAVALFGLRLPIARAEPPYEISWILQYGSSDIDYVRELASDRSGNVYVTGDSWGNIGGSEPETSRSYISKVSPQGAVEWSWQIPDASRGAQAIVADHANHVFTAGGGGFLAKYDAQGNHLWTQPGLEPPVYGYHALAVDPSGNVIAAGDIKAGGNILGVDNFLVRKFDANGVVQWSRELGTPEADFARGVATDNLGNILVTGVTRGALEGVDAGRDDVFLAKYTSNGDLTFIRQWGTDDTDVGSGVAADALGNIYVTGSTYDENFFMPNPGDLGAFVTKFSPDGTLEWTRYATPLSMERYVSRGIVIDTDGNVLISGSQTIALSRALEDVFVSKFDPAGNLFWTRRFGQPPGDISFGIALAPQGVYVAGETESDLGGPNAGNLDVFVAKLAPIPEPSTIAMLCSALLTWACVIRRRIH